MPTLAPLHSAAPNRSVDTWLMEYGASHRNRVNKRIHWVCVPIIAWCVIALLWAIPPPRVTPTTADLLVHSRQEYFNWAVVVVAAAIAYYVVLSVRLAVGAGLFFGAALVSIAALARSGVGPLWLIAVILFVLAWIGQFIGHHIEGARPSFFKDLQFLLIGPLWLVADLYRRIGIRY
jgi:uncharacterized membrane protein YGL010W